MRIKKLLLLAVMVLTMAFAAGAADLSSKALTFRSQIKSYLSNQGYTPSIDDDGDVKFKYGGYTYYIHVMEFNGNLITRYMVGVNAPDDMSRARANALCLKVSQNKICARSYLTTSGKTIFVELDAFCSGIAMFKDMFSVNMQLLDGVSDGLIEYMQE